MVEIDKDALAAQAAEAAGKAQAAAEDFAAKAAPVVQDAAEKAGVAAQDFADQAAPVAKEAADKATKKAEKLFNKDLNGDGTIG